MSLNLILITLPSSASIGLGGVYTGDLPVEGELEYSYRPELSQNQLELSRLKARNTDLGE
jgi:hypothetical protein